MAAGAGFGLSHLSKYVETTVSVSHKVGDLELMSPPGWLNEALKKKISYAATVAGEDLRLDDDAAASVQRNLESFFVWLAEPRVKINNETIQIYGQWRQPRGLIEVDTTVFYVDENAVTLDYVEMPHLPIVRIEGHSLEKTPAMGQPLPDADIAAGLALLIRLGNMDKLAAPNRPLLFQIESIDVSNFNGRQDDNQPHIVLRTKGNTEIVWGAELGKWSIHLEATDEEKLAKLYAYYKGAGSLDTGVKFINLRDPQGRIPLPIDRY